MIDVPDQLFFLDIRPGPLKFAKEISSRPGEISRIRSNLVNLIRYGVAPLA
jgi:hypothetical protein